MLGALDPEVRLRWHTAPVGDTPLHIATLPSSGTLLLATHAADRTAWLRLFKAATLQQVVPAPYCLHSECLAATVGSAYIGKHNMNGVQFKCSSAVQLAEVQLRQGQQHTALHAGQVPIAPAGSRLGVQAGDSSPGAQQTQRFSERALDLAIVAHHEPATLLQQAAAAGGPHAPTALSWLSFFTVQHIPCEDAAEDQCVCVG